MSLGQDRDRATGLWPQQQNRAPVDRISTYSSHFIRSLLAARLPVASTYSAPDLAQYAVCADADNAYLPPQECRPES